jgi:hypothetical protein
MKRYTTKKLFYRKWPYKIATSVVFGRVLLRNGMDLDPPWHSRGAVKQKSEQVQKDLRYYADAMSEFVGLPNVKLRREFDNITYFTDSKETADLIISKLSSFVTAVHEPASEEEIRFLEDNIRASIVDKLPYNTYQFKVILKSSMTATAKEQLKQWVLTNQSKLELFHAVKNCLFRNGWARAPMFYVTDEQTLLMLRLVAGDNIRSIEKFILRSCINTKS